jgi:hypothetical protein
VGVIIWSNDGTLGELGDAATKLTKAVASFEPTAARVAPTPMMTVRPAASRKVLLGTAKLEQGCRAL